MPMTNEELKNLILDKIPETEFHEGIQYLEITVPSSKLYSIASELKLNTETTFDYLFCLTGVDWTEHLMVVYHLKSTNHGHQIVLKSKLENRENPEIDSVCDLWKTAEFHEREVYDFFGIIFKNHPDLRRIFLEDDRVGWPMRKDFQDPINMIDYQ